MTLRPHGIAIPMREKFSAGAKRIRYRDRRRRREWTLAGLRLWLLIQESQNKVHFFDLRDPDRLRLPSEQPETNLSLLEEELVQHIRFEERVLFQEIEKPATGEQLAMIEEEQKENQSDEWEDKFLEP